MCSRYLMPATSSSGGRLESIRDNLNSIIPILVLVVCVCGVILILGLISGGVLAGLSVLIPCVVLGGASTVTLVGGIIWSNCLHANDDLDRESAAGALPDRSRVRMLINGGNSARPSGSTVQRRLEIFDQLPHFESVEDIAMIEGRTCSICLCDDPPQRVLLNCGHAFHENCVKEWMTRARLARCPLCRSGLASSPRARVVQPAGDNSPLPNPSCETSPQADTGCNV